MERISKILEGGDWLAGQKIFPWKSDVVTRLYVKPTYLTQNTFVRRSGPNDARFSK